MTRFKYLAIVVGSIAVVGFVFGTWLETRDQPLVVFLDVGQGDAIYIRLADGFDILIDGGPDDRVITALNHYQPFYDREIELMIMTHAHADHVTGLNEILARYTVDQVLYPGPIDYESAPYQTLLATIAKRSISLESVRAGRRYNLPGGAQLEILFPFADTPLESPDINELSVVARLTVEGQTFLFTGDAGIEVEEQLLQRHSSVNATVLKVGHHGSRGSSSQAFLDAVHPHYAVISAGEGNSYGHPHREALDRLRATGAKIFRTDQDGDVLCQISHTGINCSAQKGD